MANKLDLSIAVPSKTKSYGAFTRAYRASENVIDRRGKQYRPTTTPKDTEYASAREMSDPRLGKAVSGGGTGRVRDTADNQTVDDYSSDMSAYGGKNGESTRTPSSTRKVDSEEAIRRTHTERN